MAKFPSNCHIIRTVQKTRRPAQPGQPARVRPAATRSEDSDGRTRVPAKRTRPLTGRLSVFGVQTRNTRPEPIVYPYRRSITIFRPDPARSSRYPMKSRPDLDGSSQISVRSRRIQPYFGQISKDPVRFRPDLDGSGQISVRSQRIRLYFGQISQDPVRFRPDLTESGQVLSPVINPKPTRINPKPTRPEPKNPTRSPGRFRVNFLFTRHIRVESGLGTNPTRPDPWTPLPMTGKILLPHPHPLGPRESPPHLVKLYFLPTIIQLFLIKLVSLIKIYLKLQINLSHQIKPIFSKN